MERSIKMGAAYSCALFLCLGACSRQSGPSTDGWLFERTREGITVTADEPHADCLVAINSMEGGFRRTGSVDFPAGEGVPFHPREFTNSLGDSPGLIENVLVQCFDPSRVVVLP